MTDLQSFTLMMDSAQVVETSVNTNNSPSQDYTTNPDDHSNHNVDGTTQQSHDLQASVQFQGADWIIYRANIDIAIELLFNIIELELNSNLVSCSRSSVFVMLSSAHGLGYSSLEPSFCMFWPGTD